MVEPMKNMNKIVEVTKKANVFILYLFILFTTSCNGVENTMSNTKDAMTGSMLEEFEQKLQQQIDSLVEEGVDINQIDLILSSKVRKKQFIRDFIKTGIVPLEQGWRLHVGSNELVSKERILAIDDQSLIIVDDGGVNLIKNTYSKNTLFFIYRDGETYFTTNYMSALGGFYNVKRKK